MSEVESEGEEEEERGGGVIGVGGKMEREGDKEEEVTIRTR